MALRVKVKWRAEEEDNRRRGSRKRFPGNGGGGGNLFHAGKGADASERGEGESTFAGGDHHQSKKSLRPPLIFGNTFWYASKQPVYLGHEYGFGTQVLYSPCNLQDTETQIGKL
ncbi:hypothetical protein K504DRAFT_456892, partial [Pleomassaria siparia CBS 279.74]